MFCLEHSRIVSRRGKTLHIMYINESLYVGTFLHLHLRIPQHLASAKRQEDDIGAPPSCPALSIQLRYPMLKIKSFVKAMIAADNKTIGDRPRLQCIIAIKPC
jgi:hypothetical protein